MNTRVRRRCSHGFTLIELMVAMVITAMIVGILISITSLAMDAWQRSRSEVRAARQAKSMLDAMAKDMESFVSRQGNTFEWLYAKTVTTMPGPVGGMGSASASASDVIFCTAATDRYNGQIGSASDKGGDISCVAYKLVYQDPMKDPTKGATNSTSADFSTFAFYRKLVDPDKTFKDLLGQTDLNSAFSSYQSTIVAPDNFVCENIFQFDITFHVNVTNTSSGKVESKTVTLGQSNPELHIRGNAVTSSSSSSSTAMTVGGSPVTGVTAISISTTVLSDFAIDQMRKRRFSTADDKAKFIAKNGFHYVKDVTLPGT